MKRFVFILSILFLIGATVQPFDTDIDIGQKPNTEIVSGAFAIDNQSDFQIADFTFCQRTESTPYVFAMSSPTHCEYIGLPQFNDYILKATQVLQPPAISTTDNIFDKTVIPRVGK